MLKRGCEGFPVISSGIFCCFFEVILYQKDDYRILRKKKKTKLKTPSSMICYRQ